jgi:hypothetical protein
MSIKTPKAIISDTLAGPVALRRECLVEAMAARPSRSEIRKVADEQ